jgi:sulfite dehydrogenase
MRRSTAPSQTNPYAMIGVTASAMRFNSSRSSDNRFTVRSFITNVTDGAKLKPGGATLKGIAFDGGRGIKEVAVSLDGGKSWTPAKLGKDLGKYSFRGWKLPVAFSAGDHEPKVRATNNAGDTQPAEPLWNPAGYLRNVIETVRVTAA